MPLNCAAGVDSWSLLDSKDTKPVNVKGDQPWTFTGWTDAEVKLQYFGHLMWTDGSLEKSLMLGKIEGSRRRGHQRMWWLDGISDAMNVNLGKLWEVVTDREAWHAAVHGVAELDLPGWLNNNRIPKLFSRVVVPSCIPTHSAWVFQFL